MIDKSFIEKIEEMSKPEIFDFLGKKYSNRELHLIKEPAVQSLMINTLNGFIDYIKNSDDSKDECFVVVNSPVNVMFVSSLNKIYNSRNIFIKSQYNERPHHFGRYLPIEEFILWLLTGFKKTESRDSVIDFVSNVKHEFVKENTDNGLTQTISVKTGIAKIGEKPIPSPVNLKPFRIFSEVEQPESLFILRAKKIGDEINFMLAEADGGAWENTAILSIRDYIKAALPNCMVIA